MKAKLPGPTASSYGAAGKKPVAELLAAHGIEPVVLAEKEGLALVNGTEGMLGMLLMAIADLHLLLTTADITAALSVEALLGTDQVFLPGTARCPAAAPGAGRKRGQHAARAVQLADRRFAPRQ